jgi:hypothetical protein
VSAAGRVGCIYFYGHEGYIFGFTGVSCYAYSYTAFVGLGTYTTPLGFLQLNESSGCCGVSEKDGSNFAFDSPVMKSGAIWIANALNATLNFAATAASALSLGRGCHYLLQYCTFNSNTNCAVVLVYDAPSSSLVIIFCHVFTNNSATVQPVNTYGTGIIHIRMAVTISDCVFLEWKATYDALIGGVFSSTVILLRCVFDTSAVSGTGVLLTTSSCTVVESGIVTGFIPGYYVTPSLAATPSTMYSNSNIFHQVSDLPEPTQE